MNKMLVAVLVFCALLGAASATLATTSGTWQLARENRTHRLELRLTAAEQSNTVRMWNESGGYGVEQLGLTDARIDAAPANVQFALNREAGIFRFTGILGRGTGNGTFLFMPGESFRSGLLSRGLKTRSDGDVMTAASVDLTLSYIDDIRAAGYPSLPFDELLAFRALNVTPSSLAQLRSMFGNIEAHQVISTTALHITPAYINEMHEIGIAAVTPETAVEFKSLGITKSYVAQLAQLGFSHLKPNEIVEFRALHIDAAYIKHLAAHGLKNLTVEQLVQLKASGI
jgi:hypothetical protein